MRDKFGGVRLSKANLTKSTGTMLTAVRNGGAAPSSTMLRSTRLMKSLGCDAPAKTAALFRMRFAKESDSNVLTCDGMSSNRARAENHSRHFVQRARLLDQSLQEMASNEIGQKRGIESPRQRTWFARSRSKLRVFALALADLYDRRGKD